jgi:hypothetical protein
MLLLLLLRTVRIWASRIATLCLCSGCLSHCNVVHPLWETLPMMSYLCVRSLELVMKNENLHWLSVMEISLGE